MIKHFPAALFILFLLCSSCSSIYMPGVPNTPMLSTKGELAVATHISLKGDFNLNSAYAMGEHFGVLANGDYLKNETNRKEIRHKMIELGFGYFDTFGPENNRLIEIYGGLGSGKSNQLFRERNDLGSWSDQEIRKAGYDKKFVQVNYSSKKKNNLTLFRRNFSLNYGTALRVSFVRTDNLTVNAVKLPDEDNIFLEPVFFTRMVLSDQVQLQYTTGSNFGLKSRKYLNAGHSVFSVGAVINLGGKIKKP
ncbi:hypothetical protein D9M68_685770 [compost metagenome]